MQTNYLAVAYFLIATGIVFTIIGSFCLIFAVNGTGCFYEQYPCANGSALLTCSFDLDRLNPGSERNGY